MFKNNQFREFGGGMEAKEHFCGEILSIHFWLFLSLRIVCHQAAKQNTAGIRVYQSKRLRWYLTSTRCLSKPGISVRREIAAASKNSES
jgi:hypothetical protein